MLEAHGRNKARARPIDVLTHNWGMVPVESRRQTLAEWAAEARGDAPRAVPAPAAAPPGAPTAPAAPLSPSRFGPDVTVVPAQDVAGFLRTRLKGQGPPPGTRRRHRG